MVLGPTVSPSVLHPDRQLPIHTYLPPTTRILGCALWESTPIICMVHCTSINKLLYYAVQVLHATPSQDGFYDITDALEEQGMEQIIKVKSQAL